VVLLVASRFGRNTRGFSRGAIGFRLGSVMCVLEEAEQWWRRAGDMLPCRSWCGAGLDGVQVHGNTLHALRVLGGTVTPCGHGLGEVHGGLEVTASHGIDNACTEEFDGEVTGPEMVGGVLAMLGCPRWAWRWPGRREVFDTESLQGGAGARVPAGWRSSTGG
jgi:hypothetical protein